MYPWGFYILRTYTLEDCVIRSSVAVICVEGVGWLFDLTKSLRDNCVSYGYDRVNRIARYSIQLNCPQIFLLEDRVCCDASNCCRDIYT